MTDQETKTFRQWLILDWKTGSSRTRKSEPTASDLGANEILAELAVDVVIPKIDVPTLQLTAEVPEPNVYQAELNALDADDLPDWTDAADEAIAQNADRIKSAEPADLNMLAGHITTCAIEEAPGRPPIDVVREYVQSEIADEIGESSGGDGR